MVCIAMISCALPEPMSWPPTDHRQPVTSSTTPGLSTWFKSLLILIAGALLASPVIIDHYQQVHAPVPPIWPVPEDPIAARKALMINELLPLIQDNNRQLLEDRERLQTLLEKVRSGRSLRQREQAWLREQADQYRLELSDDMEPDETLLSNLLTHLDLVPASLALAQAAMESAWGTSRFAVEANNYFGHWCFATGCGIVPAQRSQGAQHEVARFDSASQSIERYMNNLNSHPSYQSLRLIRQQQRGQGQEPQGYDMADGLESYSSIGSDYIRAIKALIRSNDLDRFPSW